MFDFNELSSKSATPSAPNAEQAGVYARATMRRVVRKKKNVQTGKRALGEHELDIAVAKWPRGAQTARDILAGRHLCARRRVTTCA